MEATAGAAIQMAANMRLRGSTLCPSTVRVKVKINSVTHLQTAY